jgi:hypothetical protein
MVVYIGTIAAVNLLPGKASGIRRSGSVSVSVLHQAS